jgi:serralysin
LVHSAGADTYKGGAGIDLVSYKARSTAVIADIDGVADDAGEGDNVFTDVENIEGGSASDTLTGNGAANTLLGHGGADTLRGLGGNDKLLGGAGLDTLEGGAGTDTCNGEADGAKKTGCEAGS